MFIPSAWTGLWHSIIEHTTPAFDYLDYQLQTCDFNVI